MLLSIMFSVLLFGECVDHCGTNNFSGASGGSTEVNQTTGDGDGDGGALGGAYAGWGESPQFDIYFEFSRNTNGDYVFEIDGAVRFELIPIKDAIGEKEAKFQCR